MKKIIVVLSMILGLSLSLFLVIQYYGYIFSKNVTGVIDNLQRVDVNVALLQSAGKDSIPNQLFSFAVAIKDNKGEIFTASSEDRRWAVARVGQCVEVRFFPYPFWNLEKSGMYYNAKLVSLRDCNTNPTK